MPWMPSRARGRRPRGPSKVLMAIACAPVGCASLCGIEAPIVDADAGSPDGGDVLTDTAAGAEAVTDIRGSDLETVDATATGVALVAHTNATTSSEATVTTVSVDTSGSTLIVAACGWYAMGGPVTSCAITDSLANSWTSLPAYRSTAAAIQASYVVAPSTSGSHTFTATTNPGCPACYTDIWVLAFRGTSTGPSVFDKSCGNTASASPVSACAAPLVPAQAGELFVAFLDTNNAQSPLSYGIDTGFVLVDDIPTPGTVTEGGGDAYRFQEASTAINPAWTITGSEVYFATTLLAFRP